MYTERDMEKRALFFLPNRMNPVTIACSTVPCLSFFSPGFCINKVSLGKEQESPWITGALFGLGKKEVQSCWVSGG